MAEKPVSRPRGVLPPSPSTTSSSAKTDISMSASTPNTTPMNAREKNLHDLLKTLPSSPKELLQRIDRQRDEVRLLQEENMRLKAREMEVSALSLRLQQQFSTTQSQVDNIKVHINQQLANPVTEEEYNKLDELPEAKRDLLDTVKMGIYRQLGSMRASYQSATKRAAELGAAVTRLEEENRDLKLQLTEAKADAGAGKGKSEEKQRLADKQAGRIVELEATVRDLESKLKSVFLDQEQMLSARLTAQVKTDEVARLAVRLEQSEMDVERYKVAAECCEQKLDILKSEYYELKLKGNQRAMELEGALRSADEKIKMLGDLELESDLYLSNLAEQSDGQSLSLTTGGGGGGGTGALDHWAALPRSRKLTHSLTVTKRCLHLENKVTSLQQECTYKEEQIARLQMSLKVARDALNNTNSPYALVEKTLESLTAENDTLRTKAGLLETDKKALEYKLQKKTDDVHTLCKHRSELLRIRKLLKQLGLQEGYKLESEDDEKGPSDVSPRAKKTIDATGAVATPPPLSSSPKAIEITS